MMLKRWWLFLFALLFSVAAHATVVSQSVSVTYTCTGSVGPFAFVFSTSGANAISVTQNSVLLATSAYTVNPVNNNYDNGGSVTLNAACPASQPLVITRTTPLTQTSVFSNNMPAPQKTIENGLDKLTEIAQELGVHGGGFANPMTTVGDLIDGGSAGAAQRLGIGSTGQALTVVSGAPAWADVTSISVKAFGAVGNGSTDDYTSLNNALSYAESNGVSLYFPCGYYMIKSQLTWNTNIELYLYGEDSTCAYVFYGGTSSVTAALEVHNTTTPGNGYYSNVNIRNLGFAANSNALYALNIWRATATIDSVDVTGGSSSAFEGQGLNAQGSIRNLRAASQFFDPGSVGCVNGITLTDDGTYPSGNFTMEAPVIGGCSGIGFNFVNAQQITISGAQESGAHQGFYINCSLSLCNATGVRFEDSLLGEGASVASVVESAGNYFSNVNFGTSTVPVDVYGNSNTFDGHTIGLVNVESGATGNVFTNANLYAASTDAGTGTVGFGNNEVETAAPMTTAFDSFYSPNISTYYVPANGSIAPVELLGGANGYAYFSATSGTGGICFGGSVIGVSDAAGYGGVAIRGQSTTYGTCGSLSWENTLEVFHDKVVSLAPLITPASTTTAAGLNLPQGFAPTSPNNGDMWTTTAGVYARINGSTVGPFGTGGSGLSGMTAGQVGIAGSSSTITSSKPIAGSGGFLASGVNSTTANDLTRYTDTAGTTGDSGIATATGGCLPNCFGVVFPASPSPITVTSGHGGVQTDASGNIESNDNATGWGRICNVANGLCAPPTAAVAIKTSAFTFSGNLGDFPINNGSTATTGTLPTAAPGLQYCTWDKAGTTSAITIQTSASGQFIDAGGVLTASGGYIVSTGALGDGGCLIGQDTTTWKFVSNSPTYDWTIH